MTSSGKIRIYELSKDLGLDNKDVLDAAKKLSIAAKSHSSSISDEEAKRIRSLLRPGTKPDSAPSSKLQSGKEILSVKKAEQTPVKKTAAPSRKSQSTPTKSPTPQKPKVPARPTTQKNPPPGAPPNRVLSVKC